MVEEELIHFPFRLSSFACMKKYATESRPTCRPDGGRYNMALYPYGGSITISLRGRRTKGREGGS